MTQMNKPRVAVISGFSGAGKGTLVKELMKKHPYALSVSMTSRAPRSYETHGVDYHFVTDEVFEGLIREDGFLEHAGYNGRYYGTPRAFVEENLAAGRDVILEIEVQGALQIRKIYPDAVLIFVVTPTAAELERRLVERGTEEADVITKRLERGIGETESIPCYDYMVINDDLDACADLLHSLIQDRPEGYRPDMEFVNRFTSELADIVRKRKGEKA